MTNTQPAALIVGATGGIGAAVSRTVAAAGYSLSVASRKASQAESLASELGETGATVAPLEADLTTPDGASRLVQDHLSHFGRLDLLISTAGTTQRRALAEVDVDRSRSVIEVNLIGTLALVSAALPALRESAASRPGAQVILVSSIAATSPVPGFGVYSATKAAVNSLAQSVNAEENKNGIRATALCPGFVDSPFTEAIDKQPGEFLPPEDIAEAVAFLLRLSPSARVPSIEIGRINAEVGQP